MIVIKNILTGIFIVIAMLVAPNAFGINSSFTSGDVAFSWVSGLTVRNSEGKPITKLAEYESVLYLGQHSTVKESIVIRGTKFNDFRYFIKTRSGQEGWVFGGGLKKSILTDSKYKNMANSCFFANAHNDGPLLLSTEKQKNIDGAVIYKYIESLKNKPLVYKKPIYESACVGTLEEKCFVNNILEREHESGSELFLFNKFAPFLGIENGMDKQSVYKILGNPSEYNDKLSVYTFSFLLKSEDYQVWVSFKIKFYFDNLDNLESMVVWYFFNEDC
jgi:hypothetical protein